MSADNEHSGLVRKLYGIVPDPPSLSSVVTDTARSLDAEMLLLGAFNSKRQSFGVLAVHGPEARGFEEAILSYKNDYWKLDPSLRWASKNPEAGFCDTRHAAGLFGSETKAFQKWQADKLGSEHWLLWYAQPVNGVSLIARVQGRGDGSLTPASAARFSNLFLHIDTAVRLAAAPPLLASPAEAIVLLDAQGVICASTPAATRIVDEEEGLEPLRRRLREASAEPIDQLDRLIDQALSHRRTEAKAFRSAMRVAGAGEADLVITLRTLPFTGPISRWLGPALAVRIISPGATTIPFEILKDLFEFTSREAEIANHLTAGHSIESLSSVLGISRNTARVHLLSMFKKSRTNRQAELVRLLLAVAPD